MEWQVDRKEYCDTLKEALHQVDIWRDAYRDKDKNEIVRKSIDQYKADIKSLQ
jgi:adenylate kinase family enzyme